MPPELVVEARRKDVDGLPVRRALPVRARPRIGPFVFFDHMGPAELPPGRGVDVRPHPHIGLATVTFLFDGELVHRDSLGVVQPIRPGDLNWMIAGRGVVHSERTAPELRPAGPRLHGLQVWVGLPADQEECAPAFRHHPAASLPERVADGARARLLVGSAFGLRSPVDAVSETLYLDVSLEPGARFRLPPDAPELAVYVVEGDVDGEGAGKLLVYGTGSEITAGTRSRVAVIGGAPLDGHRHLDWNFVSSDRARLERARADWREGRFPAIPGDADDPVPLPG